MRDWISKNPAVIVSILVIWGSFATGYGFFKGSLSEKLVFVEALAKDNKKELQVECARSKTIDNSREAQVVGIQTDMKYMKSTIDDLKAGQAQAIRKIDAVADKFDKKFDELRNLIIERVK